VSALEGKRALVTGGSRGLGAAIARRFATEGASVAFSYHRHGDAAAETLGALEAIGRPARAFRCSVLEETQTAEMVREIVQAWGGVDILVNNAGITQNLPLPLLELEDFDRVMAVNVRGTYLTSRAVARPMIRNKSGVILNIGSLAGERALDAPIHYCASKAAVSGMTRAMAKELARHQIRVLCLAPGLLEDGVGQNLPEHRRRDYLHHCSLGRAGSFDEVAAFAAFLVSERCTFMTGETIVMDGGV